MILAYTLRSSRTNLSTKACSTIRPYSTLQQNKDYYRVLDVKKNANRREIKLAYYKLSKIYHPDVSETESAEKYKEIQEAYHVLGDERRKADYDFSVSNNGDYYNAYGATSRANSPNFGNRAWKKKSGPIYSGRTAHYDYDEHIRGHYNSNAFKSAKSAEFSTNNKLNNEKTMNHEELNNYWKTKDLGGENELTQLRNKVLSRSLLMVFLTCIFYYIIQDMKRKEAENGRQAYLNRINSINAKNSKT